MHVFGLCEEAGEAGEAGENPGRHRENMESHRPGMKPTTFLLFGALCCLICQLSIFTNVFVIFSNVVFQLLVYYMTQ